MECQTANPMGEFTIEQVKYLAKFPPNQNFNPYSQNHNPVWKNHPNFSWRNQNVVNLMEQVKLPPLPQEKKSNLEEETEQIVDM